MDGQYSIQRAAYQMCQTVKCCVDRIVSRHNVRTIGKQPMLWAAIYSHRALVANSCIERKYIYILNMKCLFGRGV